MGCNSCNNRGNTGEDFRNGDCVSDVVRGIVRAQRRAVEAEENTCFTGCDRSIEELLSPFEENRERLRHNTIPFILFNKNGGKPFTGVGVRRERDGRSDRSFFECIESPIFRAKSFVGDNENCVRLELLKPVRDRRDGHRSSQDVESERHDKHDHKCDSDLCDFLPRHTRNFRATGICITVDLDCFCGISCLDPITPLRARDSND
jgi:spore coat protein Z